MKQIYKLYQHAHIAELLEEGESKGLINVLAMMIFATIAVVCWFML